MSLESQLHAKADKIFESAYAKAFKDFEQSFAKLTGLKIIDGYQTAPEPLKPLRQVLQDYYCNQSVESRTAYSAARDLHREKFIREFVLKVEEVQAFVEDGR